MWLFVNCGLIEVWVSEELREQERQGAEDSSGLMMWFTVWFCSPRLVCFAGQMLRQMFDGGLQSWLSISNFLRSNENKVYK